MKELLGSGQYGFVWKGTWTRGTKTIDVAVKELKYDHELPEAEKLKFLQEAVTMGQFRHPNVALLCGIIVNDREQVCSEIIIFVVCNI